MYKQVISVAIFGVEGLVFPKAHTPCHMQMEHLPLQATIPPSSVPLFPDVHTNITESPTSNTSILPPAWLLDRSLRRRGCEERWLFKKH